MKIQIMSKTLRSVNFGPFCYAGAFLEEGAPDFGPNPALLFVKPHFRNVKGWDGFPQILDGYNAQLSKLPKVKVLNKMKLVEIEYVSNVCMGDDLECVRYNAQPGFNANWRDDLERRRHTYDAQLLQRFCSELLEIVPSFRKRLAKVDDFNFDSFLEWAALRFKDLPSTDESLKEYATALNSKPEESKKAESWDDLHIDWSEYHPQARETLDDLFYWDCVNEYAPHGNDEGADVLEHFQRWRKRNKTGDSKKFFERLMREWGVSNPPEDDLHDTYGPCLIGLAFAHLKVDAACPSWVRDEALKVLRGQRKNVKTSESEREYAGHLDTMIKKLEAH